MKGMKPDPLATSQRPPSWTERLAAGVASPKRDKEHSIACQGAEIKYSATTPQRHTVQRRLNDVLYVTREHAEQVLRPELLARLDAGERVATWANEYWIEGSRP